MPVQSTSDEVPSQHGPLRDLIRELERAAGMAALCLQRARDPSIARTSGTLALRAEALLLAHILERPQAELEADARKLAVSFVQLEFVATRSRLPIQDRASITVGRALASQVCEALFRSGTKRQGHAPSPRRAFRGITTLVRRSKTMNLLSRFKIGPRLGLGFLDAQMSVIAADKSWRQLFGTCGLLASEWSQVKGVPDGLCKRQ